MKKLLLTVLCLFVFIIYTKDHQVYKVERIDIGSCDKVWHVVESGEGGREFYIEVKDILDWWEVLPDGKWTNMGTK